MLELLLLPIRLVFLFFELLFLVLLFPFRLLLALSVTALGLVGVFFVLGGILLIFTIAGIIPGALLGLFGLALLTATRSPRTR